jgi:4-carboxymuconolactone decarboxylase
MSPRIPPLPREEWTDRARDVFGYWEGDEARTNGSRSNTMMVLANHPDLAIASLDFGKYFMSSSTLSGRLQRMVVLRVAHHTGSHYQWKHNGRIARQMGMTAGEVAALAAPLDMGPWDPVDYAMLAVVDQLLASGKIDDRAWAELISHVDVRQALDLIQATGYFTTVAWTLIAAGVEIEPDFAEFVESPSKAD